MTKKLPKNLESIRKAALAYPDTHEAHPWGEIVDFAEPTHYGLGRHGWVSCMWAKDADIPVADALCWVDESYRAVAPKKVLAKLGESLK